MKKVEHLIIGGIENKKCSKCGVYKSLDKFCIRNTSSDRHNSVCKECAIIENNTYRTNNPDRTKEYYRKYNREHKEQRTQYGVAYNRRKLATDVQYRISLNIRNRVRLAIKNNQKSGSTIELLGCSISYLRNYLEKQFDETMSWDNYGIYWHIDHIKPCASFDLSDPKQQRKCFHYSNLQPLEKLSNLSKGSSF